MTTIFKKGALIFTALFAGALLFAEPAISDYQGKDKGAKVPAWVELFDKAAANQTSGAIGFTSKTKKLYKKLGVANDKILFYSVQTGSDKDAAIANAKAQAKDTAAKCVLNDAQKILDEKLGAGKAALTQPKDIFGFARAQEFWTNNGGQFKAYSIWQITGLNYIEAGKALANSYLQEHGLLPKGEGSNER